MLALCALFIRIIPDYSKDSGYAIVGLSGYKKYQQGYCLTEDRILDRKELLKRLANSYFTEHYNYENLRNSMIVKHDMELYGSNSWYRSPVSSLYLIYIY